jgi:hypothetical protein
LTVLNLPAGPGSRGTLTVAVDVPDEFGFVTDIGNLAQFQRCLDATFDHRLIIEVIDVQPATELPLSHLGMWFVKNLPPLIDGRSTRSASRRCGPRSALWERS